jgi:septal ring factor EnvC (AmiA/AmiB activator)
MLAAPGTYTATLVKIVEGETTALAGPVSFEVERLRKGALEGASPEETVAFWQQLAATRRATTAASRALTRAFERTKELQVALGRSRSAPNSLDAELHAIEQELYAIEEGLSGHRSRGAVGEANVHTVSTRLRAVSSGTRSSTYGPTPTHRRSLEIAQQEFEALRQRLNAVLEERLPALEKKLEEAGAPWTPGQPVPPVG